MNTADFYTKELGIAPKAMKFVNTVHKEVKNLYSRVEKLSEYHQARILKYMHEYNISGRHFYPSTGYGYGDDGRDTLDKLFAAVFGGEDALVRPHWVSGTHVLGDSLFALLRPGDTLLSVTGKPYDTLEEIIGEEADSDAGSLKEWGINYIQLDLTPEGKVDTEKLSYILEKTKVKVAFIQRSRGYTWRPSFSIKEIQQLIDIIKNKQPDTIILVDNCYGEFTEELEPCHVGADIAVGSLIKNPGGGLAPTGAYAVGKYNVIEKLSYRLTAPGIGREVGSYAFSYLPYYQGFFMAPHVVAESIKGAILAAKLFELAGYTVLPKWDEPRSDIIQSIRFNTPEELICFCQAIQSASPVDSKVVPYPWDMPGYRAQVIMAAGTFVQGASIELSADAPLKEPYIAYLQGGLTFAHVKIALMKVLTTMAEKGFINL